MSWRDAPLYIESYDLVRWLLERTDAWPVDVPLRCRLGNAGFELLEAVSLALTFPRERTIYLQQADAAIVCLRVLLRLARDLGLLSGGGQRFSTGRLLVIGRMVGGWRKRTERSRLPSADQCSIQGTGHPVPGV